MMDVEEVERRIAEIKGWTDLDFKDHCGTNPQGNGPYPIPQFARDPSVASGLKAELRDANVEFRIHHFTKVQVGERRVNINQTQSPTNSGRSGRDSFKGIGRTGRIEEEAVARFWLACYEAGLLPGGA